MALKEVSLTINGTVEVGFGKARSSGYPTANITLSHPLEISEGIYCALTTIGGEATPVPSIVFYGVPYAIAGVDQPRFEVHLLEKDASLYGQELIVQLVAFVRENKKFKDVERLQSAIEEDMQTAREYFNLL